MTSHDDLVDQVAEILLYGQKGTYVSQNVAFMYGKAEKVVALVQADERERIAQAIETLEIRQPWGPGGPNMVNRSDAARIARKGGVSE